MSPCKLPPGYIDATLFYMISNTFSQAVEVSLSFYSQHPQDQYPERRIPLSRENRRVQIGRTSKRATELAPAISNGWLDSPVISRDHAEIFIESLNQHVHIVDQGSRHGTYLNKKRLEPHIPVPLRDGDIVKFGIDIQRDDTAHPPPSARVGLKVTPDQDQHNSRPEPRNNGFSVPDDSDSGDSSEDEDDISILKSMKALRSGAGESYPRIVAESTEYGESPAQSATKTCTGPLVIDVDQYVPNIDPYVVDLTGGASDHGAAVSKGQNLGTSSTIDLTGGSSEHPVVEKLPFGAGCHDMLAAPHVVPNYTTVQSLSIPQPSSGVIHHPVNVDAEVQDGSDPCLSDGDNHDPVSGTIAWGEDSSSESSREATPESISSDAMLADPPEADGFDDENQWGFEASQAGSDLEDGSSSAASADKNLGHTQGMALEEGDYISCGETSVPADSFLNSNGDFERRPDQFLVGQEAHNPQESSAFYPQMSACNGPGMFPMPTDHLDHVPKPDYRLSVPSILNNPVQHLVQPRTTSLDTPNPGTIQSDCLHEPSEIQEHETEPCPMLWKPEECPGSPPTSRATRLQWEDLPQPNSGVVKTRQEQANVLVPLATPESPLIESGDRFLSCPPREPSGCQQRESPELDMSSAWQFQQSKASTSAKPELATSSSVITTGHSDQSISGSCSAAALWCVGSHATDNLSNPSPVKQQGSTSLKRKADEISNLTDAKSEALDINGKVSEDSTQHGEHSAKEIETASENPKASSRPVNGDMDAHASKKIRRVAEAVRFVAIGGAAAGVALFTTLVATAPSFS